MKRFATLAVLAFALAAPAAIHAEEALLLFDYVGFDYESPDPNPSLFGDVGSGYVSVGTVENLFFPLVFDESTYQYTYVISGMVATARTTYGDFVVVDYTPGYVRVYEDLHDGGTPPLYGVNPPNATAPGNFSDGVLFFEGTLTNFQVVFNTNNQSGSFSSELEVTGGTQLEGISPSDRDGWTFAGITGNATNIPLGYDHQVDGQVLLTKPTLTRSTSWGALKATYR